MSGRPPATFSYSYADLESLTDIKQNSIQVAVSRGRRDMPGGFIPEDFRSVVKWIFRNASDELRFEIMTEMGFFKNKEKAKRIQEKVKRVKAPRAD